MSPDLGIEPSLNDQPKLIATSVEEGYLVEQIACASSTALTNHLLRCNREGRKLFPGHPVKLPENSAQRINYFLTLDGADAIIEHSRPDQVISVQAGISIADLQMLLAQNKQWFPVCLPDENISVMEYINYGNSGSLEQLYGEARDLVLGMQVALGTGELIKCGGKVVKNVTGYDLPKLFAGSHGTLCIPFSAHLRLYALPETSGTLVFHFKEANAAFQAARALRRSGLPLSCLEIVDSEIFKLIDTEKISAQLAELSKDKIMLCTQIHGTVSVVAELQKALSKVVDQPAADWQKLEQKSEEQLWKFLSQPSFFLHGEWIELCGPTRSLEAILGQMKDKYKNGASLEGNFTAAWTARPGRNKALLVLGDMIDGKFRSGCLGRVSSRLKQFINEVTGIAAKLSSPITIACADETYLWNVQTLPKDDQVLNELKHRLKHQYDPAGILNPLVSL